MTKRNLSQYARVSFPSASIKVGDGTVLPVKCVGNLGAFFDSHLNMVDHISQIAKTGYYHFQRLKSILSLKSKFLTKEATERIVHAFITSKLDTNNGLLYGIDDCQLKSLEMLQNSASRLVTGARKYDSITPILNHQSSHYIQDHSLWIQMFT